MATTYNDLARGRKLAWFALLLLYLPASGQQDSSNMKAVAEANLNCLACEHPIDGGGTTLIHKGRAVHLHKNECLAHFQDDPDRFFHVLQARAVLFDESMHAEKPLSNAWLFAGLYVLLGLVCAGMCGCFAVGRGYPPLGWFFAGFFGNVAAVAVLLAARRKAVETAAAGLRKVPATHEPIHCGSCSTENHPSARACSGCGAELSPQVSSELERANAN